MSYTPQSKISFKSTLGGELVSKLTRKIYVGDYMEFSNGNLYAGKISSNLEIELTHLIKETNNRSIGVTYDARRYSNLKPPSLNLSKYKQLPHSKPQPTEEDYKIGYFPRYFVKRVNQQFGFFEINSETFDSIITQKEEFDPNLYLVGSIKWSLTDDTHKTNTLQIQRLRQPYPLLSLLFQNTSEYKRNNLQNPEILESLVANQGELFYLDGSPYPEGALYHTHPTKGPMEGAIHIPESHKSLSFSSTPPLPPPLPPTLPTNNSGENNSSGY